MRSTSLVLILCAFVQVNWAIKAEEVVATSSDETSTDTCLAFVGYDIRPGYDLDMIYGSNNAHCCRLCFDREDCKGWTMYEGKCHLKGTNELVVARDSTGTVSGIKNSGGDAGSPNFSDKSPQVESPKDSEGQHTTCSVLNDVEIVGTTLENKGYMYLSQCCHECGNTEGCSGWTYHEWQCILKSGTELQPSVGDISGLKLAEDK